MSKTISEFAKGVLIIEVEDLEDIARCLHSLLQNDVRYQPITFEEVVMA